MHLTVGLTRSFIALLSCLSIFGYATDLRPWPTSTLLFLPHADLITQYYQTINAECGNRSQPSFNNFLNLGMEVGALDLVSLEAEALLARTHEQSFGFDSLRLTARYFWANGIPDDTLSSAVGVTVIPVFKNADHDPGSFHHGSFETEAHLSFGREYSWDRFWTCRWWNVLAIGIADRGSPWVRTQSVWEQNYWDCAQWRLYVNTLWGLGSRSFPCCLNEFKSYGSIHHQSIDIGTGYTYFWNETAYFSIDYSYRLYAKNYPSRANTLMLSVIYPFGPCSSSNSSCCSLPDSKCCGILSTMADR